MHGPATILILAKKKAGGGGYFDPMADAEMAMGPMEYESEDEGEESEGEESEGEKASLGKMDFRDAAAKLREIATQLEKSSVMHGEQAKVIKEVIGDEVEEDESTEEEPMPEPPKAKKGPPAFMKPKPMKY